MDKNSQAKIVKERTIQVGQINYVSTSTLKDDWFSIVENNTNEKGDLLLNCIFKTEFFTCLEQAKGKLAVKIGES